MFKKILSILPTGKARDVLATTAGVSSLIGGQKLIGAGVLARNFWRLEQRWRHQHEFHGDMNTRIGLALLFYDATHQNHVYRALRILSMPGILAGTAGLLIFRPRRPMWLASSATLLNGTSLHLIARAMHRKGPSVADDPVAFVVGPLWDLAHLIRHRRTFSPVRPNNPMSVMGLSPELVH